MASPPPQSSLNRPKKDWLTTLLNKVLHSMSMLQGINDLTVPIDDANIDAFLDLIKSRLKSLHKQICEEKEISDKDLGILQNLWVATADVVVILEQRNNIQGGNARQFYDEAMQLVQEALDQTGLELPELTRQDRMAFLETEDGSRQVETRWRKFDVQPTSGVIAAQDALYMAINSQTSVPQHSRTGFASSDASYAPEIVMRDQSAAQASTTAKPRNAKPTQHGYGLIHSRYAEGS